jgi:hypothetical protein
MPRMAAATTAARSPMARMASTALTAPTAACVNRCHYRQLGHPPARASAWRHASAPIATTADRTPPCNRRRLLWLYGLHRLQGCRPLLAASRPAHPRRPRQSQRPLRRWRHRPHPRHRGLRHRRRRCTHPRRPRRVHCRRPKAPPYTRMPTLQPRDGRPPLSKARRVDSLACSRWSCLRCLVSSYGWWGCLEHCVRARCETGRKEQVGVGEEGRSRDVLDGESGWLSSSASTGWRALNANLLYSSAGATLGPIILVGHTQASTHTVLPRRLWTTVFCAAARILFAQQ